MATADLIARYISKDEYALVRGEAISRSIRPQRLVGETQIASSHGSQYNLSDAADGMKMVVNGRGSPVTSPFYLSPETEIFAFDSDGNGSDEIYLNQTILGGPSAVFDASRGSSDIPQKKFKLRIPYDVDLFFDDGCYGTDLGVEPNPVILLWDGRALTIEYDERRDFVVASGIALRREGGMPLANQSSGIHPTRKDGLRTEEDVLLCAYQHYTGAGIRRMLRGALFLLRDARSYEFEPENGVHILSPIDINFSYGWNKISIQAGKPTEIGKPITEVIISVRGWNSKKAHYDLHLNRRGDIYSYDRGRVNFRPIDNKQLDLLRRALRLKLDQDNKNGNKSVVEALETVAAIVKGYPDRVYPSWLFR